MSITSIKKIDKKDIKINISSQNNNKHSNNSNEAKNLAPYSNYNPNNDTETVDLNTNNSNEIKKIDSSELKEYVDILKKNGLIESDINRVLNGEISIEELIKEIDNDPDNTRKKLMIESSYIQYTKNNLKENGIDISIDFNSLEELNIEISNITNELNQATNEKNNLEESEQLLKIIEQIENGMDLDSALSSKTVAYKYTDSDGSIKYIYNMPIGQLKNDQLNPGKHYIIGLDGKMYESLTYIEMYGESDLVKELRKNLTKEESSLFGQFFLNQEDAIYTYKGLEDQKKYIDSLKEKVKNSKEERKKFDQKITELQNKLSVGEYIYNNIKEETEHYINNIDIYTRNDDFLGNNRFKTETLDTLNNLKEKYKGSANLSVVGTNNGTQDIWISSKKEITDILSCIINDEGNIKSQYISIDKNIYKISSQDEVYNHFIKWAPLMTEQEKEVYNYIVNKKGAEEAYEYLKNISNELDKRWLENQRAKDTEYAIEHPIAASLGSVLYTPMEGLSAACYSMSQYFNEVSHPEDENAHIYRSDVYSSGNIWRSAVAQDIAANHGEGWSFVYSTGMSMADSLTLIGASVLTGGTAAPALSASIMGSRVYVSTLNEALDRGLSDGQAIALAWSSAAAETAMESFSLGHLLNLEENLGKGTITLGKKIASNFKNEKIGAIATKGFYILANSAKQGLAEGEEEFGTEIVNYLADILIAQDKSVFEESLTNYINQGYTEGEAFFKTLGDLGIQASQAFVGGFVSGNCFGGFAGTKSTINTSYGISHQMYNEFESQTKGEQFFEAIEINQQQLKMIEEIIKDLRETGNLKRGESLDFKKIQSLSKEGIITNNEANLLINGTIEQQASNRILNQILNNKEGIITNNEVNQESISFSSIQEIAEYFGDSNLYLSGLVNQKNKEKKIGLNINQLIQLKKEIYKADETTINKFLKTLTKQELGIYKKIQRQDSIQNKWIDKLTNDEKYALRDYAEYFGSFSAEEAREWYGYDSKGKSYVNINELIRAGLVDGNSNVDSAIEKFGILPNQIEVYRRVNMSALTEQFGNIDINNLNNLIGKIYRDKGYMSTSLLENKALTHMAEKTNIVLKIKVPNDANYGAYIESQSNLNYGQLEFLIKRNSTSVIENAYVNENGEIVVEMKLFDNQETNITINNKKIQVDNSGVMTDIEGNIIGTSNNNSIVKEVLEKYDGNFDLKERATSFKSITLDNGEKYVILRRSGSVIDIDKFNKKTSIINKLSQNGINTPLLISNFTDGEYIYEIQSLSPGKTIFGTVGNTYQCLLSSINQLNQLANLDEESYLKFVSDLCTIRSNGLEIDQHVGNLLLDSNKINYIDLSLNTDSQTNHDKIISIYNHLIKNMQQNYEYYTQYGLEKYLPSIDEQIKNFNIVKEKIINAYANYMNSQNHNEETINEIKTKMDQEMLININPNTNIEETIKEKTEMDYQLAKFEMISVLEDLQSISEEICEESQTTIPDIDKIVEAIKEYEINVHNINITKEDIIILPKDNSFEIKLSDSFISKVYNTIYQENIIKVQEEQQLIEKELGIKDKKIQIRDKDPDVTAEYVTIDYLLKIITNDEMFNKFQTYNENNIEEKKYFSNLSKPKYLQAFMQLNNAIKKNNYNLFLSDIQAKRLESLYNEAINTLDISLIEYNESLPNDIKIKLMLNTSIIHNDNDLNLLYESFFQTYNQETLDNNPALIYSEMFEKNVHIINNYLGAKTFLTSETREKWISLFDLKYKYKSKITKEKINIGYESFNKFVSEIFMWNQEEIDYVNYFKSYYPIKISNLTYHENMPDDIKLRLMIEHNEIYDRNIVINEMLHQFSDETSNSLNILDDLFQLYLFNIHDSVLPEQERVILGNKSLIEICQQYIEQIINSNKNISINQFKNLLNIIYSNYLNDVNISGISEYIDNYINNCNEFELNNIIELLNYKENMPEAIKIKIIEKILENNDVYLSEIGTTMYGIDQNATSKYIQMTIKNIDWLTDENDFLQYLINKRNYNVKEANKILKSLKKGNYGLLKFFKKSPTSITINDARKASIIIEYVFDKCARENRFDIIDIIEQSFTCNYGNEIIRLGNKLNSQGMSKMDAIRTLSAIDSTGCCSYAAVANSIVLAYKGKETEFERDFGYPMYVYINGKKEFNSSELILDMYTYLNSNKYADSRYKGNMFVYDEFGKIHINNLITNNQVYLSSSLSENISAINSFLKSHNSNLLMKYKYKNNNDYTIVDAGRINIELKENILNHLNKSKNNSVNLGIFRTKKPVRFMKNTKENYITTDNWNEGAGHAVCITGILDDYLIVSSWGKKLYIPIEDLNGNMFSIFFNSLEGIE